MKQFLQTITLLALVLFLNGCKKYSEDEGRSFKKPENRLVRQNKKQAIYWICESYKLNGTEQLDKATFSSDLYKQYPRKKITLDDIYFRFREDGTLSQRYDSYYEDLNTTLTDAYGYAYYQYGGTNSIKLDYKWELTNHNKEISISGSGISANYKILRLDDKQLHITYEDKDKYDLTFKRDKAYD